MLDKIKGGLFGVAVGDALGGTLEFMAREQVEAQYGFLKEIVGGGCWMLEPGEVTDDTQMTLCVAEGILENPSEPLPAIGRKFVEWMETKPKDAGITVRYALSYYSHSKNWETAAKQAHLYLSGKSAGNGTLMRTLPAALAYSDLAQMAKIARFQSKLTHYDDLAAEACAIYCAIARRVLEGESLKKAIQAEIEGTLYEGVLSKDPDCLPDGYVVNSMKWALRTLLTSVSFEDAVTSAANLGEDADTTAAIAGGLAGVYWGYEGIPQRYRDAILIKEALLETAERLHGLRQSQT